MKLLRLHNEPAKEAKKGSKMAWSWHTSLTVTTYRPEDAATLGSKNVKIDCKINYKKDEMDWICSIHVSSEKGIR
jgi:hypothetical protein